MSRIGNRIITVPEGVTVTEENGIVKVTGPKGSLQQTMLKKITMKQESNKITLERADESAKANHGTMNSLITNMIKGVTAGYEKGLEIIGVGYNFKVQGSTLTIKAGYSHPVDMKVPEGLTVEAVSNTEIKVKDPNKWELKHRLIYKQHYGEIPKGHNVIFADRNIQNFDINNLVLVSKAEMLILNNNKLIFEDEELTKVGVNIAKVIDKTKKRSK